MSEFQQGVDKEYYSLVLVTVTGLLLTKSLSLAVKCFEEDKRHIPRANRRKILD